MAISRWMVALAAAFAFGLAGPALAQTFRPGAEIEYKAQNWPETWEKGVIVRELPGGTQVLVREKPTQFFPEGFERAYALADVRPAAPAAPPPARPRADVPAAPARPVAVVPARPAAPPAVPGARGTGPMSEQEVLGFLKARLGDGDPFMNPKREAVLQALREEVLRRGVNFRSHAIGPFADQLGKYGALSNVTYALSSNYGPPATLPELYGKWRLIKVGATTTFTRGSEVWQRGEYAGLAGALTVNPNGTYVWDSPSGVFRGSWRRATAAEMGKSDKGGEGLVLLGAKSGADWLVFRRKEEGPEGDGVLVTDLNYRNIRERGTR